VDATTACLSIAAFYESSPVSAIADAALLSALEARTGVQITADTAIDEATVSALLNAAPLHSTAHGTTTVHLPYLLHLLNIPFDTTRYLQLVTPSSGDSPAIDKMEDTGAAQALFDVLSKVDVNLDRLDMSLEISKEDKEVIKDLLG
jgi:hypothetical protein